MSDDKTRSIVRYTSNRKMYDKVKKNYVQYFDIAKFIKQGYKITVTENPSNNDVTYETLLRAVYEFEKDINDKDNLGILEEILKTKNSSISEYINDLLNQVVFYKTRVEGMKRKSKSSE
jgi:polyhydroxyalkanoate synthesis regulator protein